MRKRFLLLFFFFWREKSLFNFHLYFTFTKQIKKTEDESKEEKQNRIVQILRWTKKVYTVSSNNVWMTNLMYDRLIGHKQKSPIWTQIVQKQSVQHLATRHKCQSLFVFDMSQLLNVFVCVHKPDGNVLMQCNAMQL